MKNINYNINNIIIYNFLRSHGNIHNMLNILQ